MEFGAGTFDLEQDKRYAALPEIIAPDEPVATRPFYLGLPQWGVKEWKGDLYPPGLAAKDFLSFYARYFNCVELSSTFYAHVSDEQIANWRAQVGADFKFLPKWPKAMTHNKMLRDCAAELKEFVRQLELFGPNLGTSILQLPPNFSREDNRALYFFLQAIPRHIPVAIELRHSSWFHQGKLYERLEDYLRREGISTVVADTPDRPDLFHTSFTGPFCIIRYLSDRHAAHDEWRLSKWREWLLKTSYDFALCLHRDDNIEVPRLTQYVDPALWQTIHAPPADIEVQTTLF